MEHGPRPGDWVRRFEFDGAAGLNRDHRGLTVVADVDGSGEFGVNPPDAAAEVWVDELRTSSRVGRFDHSLLVTAAGEDSFRVDVHLGSRPAITGLKPVRIERAVEGSGWVVEAEGAVELDGRSEAHLGPYPAPFFMGAAFAGWAQVAVTGRPARLVADYRAEDAGKMFAVQNVSTARELASTFADGTCRTAMVLSHLNAATFRVSGLCGGALILRKVYDRFHGRQRARVLVDGVLAGWWYEPAQDRHHRWGVSTFGLPAELVAARSEAEITIDPPAGSALWSFSSMSVFEAQ